MAAVRSLGMGEMCKLCWGNPSGRSPFGMSTSEQIEEKGLGGEWVGEKEDGWV